MGNFRVQLVQELPQTLSYPNCMLHGLLQHCPVCIPGGRDRTSCCGSAHLVTSSTMGLFPFVAKRAASHSVDQALIDLISVHVASQVPSHEHVPRRSRHMLRAGGESLLASGLRQPALMDMASSMLQKHRSLFQPQIKAEVVTLCPL